VAVLDCREVVELAADHLGGGLDRVLSIPRGPGKDRFDRGHEGLLQLL
jgi:hypothetical protein